MCSWTGAAAPATVVGHSYGGGVAILLAARRPEVVSGLVLVGSVGRADSLNAWTTCWRAVGREALAAAGLLAFGQGPAAPAEAGQATHPGRRLAWLRGQPPRPALRRGGVGDGRQVWRSFVAEQRALMREIGDVEAALSDRCSVPRW